MAGLLFCFRIDSAAIIEPFVDNLVEYNIAISGAFGDLRASVIERPLKESEFLDFGDKYLTGDKEGPKTEPTSSEGMASLNRVINPGELSKKGAKNIKSWALQAFEALGLAGSVRIDFLGNEKTGDLWLNEINTTPGSFAYYLWQESRPSASFTELTTALIEEGFRRSAINTTETDRTLGGAAIFKND
jgi:D-alanine-D-alanine ligase